MGSNASVVLNWSAFRSAVSRVEWNVTGYECPPILLWCSWPCSSVARYYPQLVMMAMSGYGKSGQMVNGNQLGTSVLSKLSQSHRLINRVFVWYECIVSSCWWLPCTCLFCSRYPLEQNEVSNPRKMSNVVSWIYNVSETSSQEDLKYHLLQPQIWLQYDGGWDYISHFVMTVLRDRDYLLHRNRQAQQGNHQHDNTPYIHTIWTPCWSACGFCLTCSTLMYPASSLLPSTEPSLHIFRIHSSSKIFL